MHTHTCIYIYPLLTRPQLGHGSLNSILCGKNVKEFKKIKHAYKVGM